MEDPPIMETAGRRGIGQKSLSGTSGLTRHPGKSQLRINVELFFRKAPADEELHVRIVLGCVQGQSGTVTGLLPSQG